MEPTGLYSKLKESNKKRVTYNFKEIENIMLKHSRTKTLFQVFISNKTVSTAHLNYQKEKVSLHFPKNSSEFFSSGTIGCNSSYIYIFAIDLSLSFRIHIENLTIEGKFSISSPVPKTLITNEDRETKRRTVINGKGVMRFATTSYPIKLHNVSENGCRISYYSKEASSITSNKCVSLFISHEEVKCSTQVVYAVKIENYTFLGLRFSTPQKLKCKLLPEHLEFYE